MGPGHRHEKRPLSFSIFILVYRDEFPERPVIASLRRRGEYAGREFLAAPMIGQAFAADALAAARFVGAVAPVEGLFLAALVHRGLLFRG
jgi:hypothetical protein